MVSLNNTACKFFDMQKVQRIFQIKLYLYIFEQFWIFTEWSSPYIQQINTSSFTATHCEDNRL